MIRASRLSYSCGLSFSASDTCFSFSSSCTKRAIVTGAIDNLPLGSQGDQSNPWAEVGCGLRSEEHTSELQSRGHLVCRLLLEKKIDTVGFDTLLNVGAGINTCTRTSNVSGVNCTID